LLVLTLRKFFHNNLRRKNVTLFNQFRCRNIADYLTIYFRIIHPWFENSKRMLRSSSEEVAAIRISSKVLRSREKVSLHRIMRFIKVDRIDLNKW
jgi:hypothetical protein